VHAEITVVLEPSFILKQVQEVTEKIKHELHHHISYLDGVIVEVRES
jgi:hypothetical protein